MREPLVVAVMLTTGSRSKMLLRAIGCFKDQIYPNTQLCIRPNDGKRPLCHLMNESILEALRQYPDAKYIAKWDDDDMSDQRRIAEQVQLLQTFEGDKRVTGYYDMPFIHAETGEVTLYSNPTNTYALGTSLLFHRSAWEQKQFPDTTDRTARGTGSDTQWVTYWAGEGRIRSVSCFPKTEYPRMIATLHADNTAPAMKRGGFEPCSPLVADQIRRRVAQM